MQRIMQMIGEADHLLDECKFHRQQLWIRSSAQTLLDADDIIQCLAYERSEFDFREESEFGFLMYKFKENLKEHLRLESILDKEKPLLFKINPEYVKNLTGEGSE